MVMPISYERMTLWVPANDAVIVSQEIDYLILEGIYNGGILTTDSIRLRPLNGNLVVMPAGVKIRFRERVGGFSIENPNGYAAQIVLGVGVGDVEDQRFFAGSTVPTDDIHGDYVTDYQGDVRRVVSAPLAGDNGDSYDADKIETGGIHKLFNHATYGDSILWHASVHPFGGSATNPVRMTVGASGNTTVSNTLLCAFDRTVHLQHPVILTEDVWASQAGSGPARFHLSWTPV